MSWTALVPLKAAGQRKTRLAGRLGPGQRHALSERMATHVLGVASRCAGVGTVRLLSPAPRAGVGWIRDGGRGLNAELMLAVAAMGAVDIVILHADLPLLTEAELIGLLDAAAASGLALAPDGPGIGTNAIAMRRDVRIGLSFGTGSFARHVEAARRAGLGPAIVRLAGLARDIDVPDDLAAIA